MAITNKSLGEMLGVSHAMASRYRSGDRLPSVEVMNKIREIYGWSIDDQVAARLAGNYHIKFCELIDPKPVAVA